MERKLIRQVTMQNCFPALEIQLKKTFEFSKVVWRHYSGEVANVYITLWQIYSGYCIL